jgi:superfamily II DNA or RNA helicase
MITIIYTDIKKEIELLQEYINDCGKIPTPYIEKTLKEKNIFTDDCINLIKEDLQLFDRCVEYYKDKFLEYMNDNSEIDFDDINYESLFILSNPNSNEKKQRYNRFTNIIISWLKKTQFFQDLFRNCPQTITISDIANAKNESTILLSPFIPRINQKDAFDKLEKFGLVTGIHCQATGCGKTNIILKYIGHTFQKKDNCKIILFTERVSILKDLFYVKRYDGTLVPDIKNITKWKNDGLCDLTNFNIINRVTIKTKDWYDELTKSTKPTLLVINRAYLTLDKLYKSFQKKDIDLILHDECHNTSSIQCHDFLLYCNSLTIPIVGFSATPVRSGKGDIYKLLEIYACANDKNKLNLITDYNMIYAISNKLILPPEFYWYQIEYYNKNKVDKMELVTQEELGSILELLNSIIHLLPNKKIVAWCGTISMAKKWKELFENNYKQRVNLKDFTFGLDTSQIIKRDKKEDSDYDKFRSSSGKSILFCANKHREGSDINLLDCCMFLDKVKDRGAIPFIQSIGRVLRLPKETENKDKPNKTKGIIIDGYVKENNNYDKEFIKKIIGYYIALQNLTGLETCDDENKSTAFIKALDVINFDKSTQEIKFKLGTEEIKIHCNKLEWNNISKHFEKFLQQKLAIPEIKVLELEYNNLKLKIKNKFKSNLEYINWAVKNNEEINPQNKYSEYWKNWYDFLQIDISIYPKNKEGLINICNSLNIYTQQQYFSKIQLDNTITLPLMPCELYSDFNYNLL